MIDHHPYKLVATLLRCAKETELNVETERSLYVRKSPFEMWKLSEQNWIACENEFVNWKQSQYKLLYLSRF